MLIIVHMDVPLGVVKASKLYRFCHTPYPTFQAWVRAGWFGEEKRKVGEGNQRIYTFEEAVLARIIAEISPLIQSHNRAAGKDLRDGLRKVVKELVTEMKEGKPLPDFETLCWTGKEFHLTKMYHNRQLRLLDVIPREKLEALSGKSDKPLLAILSSTPIGHPHYGKIKKDAGRATAWLTIPFADICEETAQFFERETS